MRCGDCGQDVRDVCLVERVSTMSAPLSEARPTFTAELCRTCYAVAEAAYVVKYGTAPRPFVVYDLDRAIARVERAQAKRERRKVKRRLVEYVDHAGPP